MDETIEEIVLSPTKRSRIDSDQNSSKMDSQKEDRNEVQTSVRDSGTCVKFLLHTKVTVMKRFIILKGDLKTFFF